MIKKIKHYTIMFSSGRKTLLQKNSVSNAKRNIHKDTKLSSLAFPSSLFLGTQEDLKIKSQNFKPENDLTSYQDQSYYFTHKFRKNSRRGDVSNVTKWWPGDMKSVFLSNMRARFFKVSPRVKVLWRIYFSQKYHRKDN